MRSRVVLLSLCVYFALLATGCKKPATDNSAGTAANDAQTSAADDKAASQDAGDQKEQERREAKKQPLVVPSGTEITISLGSSIGSKISKSGDTFTGSVARDVMVGNTVAIPQGASVSGTVTDAKPLGKFKGGAFLRCRLDSVRVNDTDVPVQTAVRRFSEKGKGKRTAVLTGGGAALGGIIGALAGGGKGAAIGAAAGAGAGAGGSAFTGNKEIVLHAEANLSFELLQPLEVRQ